MSHELRLTIELIPATSWNHNLRNSMPRPQWEKIRKAAIAAAASKCAICHAEGRLNCHEIWHYDDARRTQKLVGFTALCNMCHFVKHIGLAGVLASQGQLDYEALIQHFIAVNSCDRATFESHFHFAKAQWAERSAHPYEVDLGGYRDMIRAATP